MARHVGSAEDMSGHAMRTGTFLHESGKEFRAGLDVRLKGRTMTMDLAIREADGVKIRFAEAGERGGETAVLTSPWAREPARLPKGVGPPGPTVPRCGYRSSRIRPVRAPARPAVAPAMGAFLLQLVSEWQLGPVHLVAPDVGTSAALWAAAESPALVRSLAIGGGASAVPLQVGGGLQNIIEAPDMEGYRQVDSREILGPVYDAMAGGPPPPDVRADYLESDAGDRFVESARYVRTYPVELPKLAQRLPGIVTPVQIVCGRDDPSSRPPTRSSCASIYLTAGWTFSRPDTTRGRRRRTGARGSAGWVRAIASC